MFRLGNVSLGFHNVVRLNVSHYEQGQPRDRTSCIVFTDTYIYHLIPCLTHYMFSTNKHKSDKLCK